MAQSILEDDLIARVKRAQPRWETTEPPLVPMKKAKVPKIDRRSDASASTRASISEVSSVHGPHRSRRGFHGHSLMFVIAVPTCAGAMSWVRLNTWMEHVANFTFPVWGICSEIRDTGCYPLSLRVVDRVSHPSRASWPRPCSAAASRPPSSPSETWSS